MDNLPKARQVLVVSTGPLAAFKFGFWSLLGAATAGYSLLALHRYLRLGWGLLRTWWGL
jgi:hypothetical protein